MGSPRPKGDNVSDDKNLLIDNPKTILDETIAREGLKIAFEYGDKPQIANLDEELSLGDRVFDPFLLIRTIEKIPSLIAFYSNVSRAAKRQHAQAKQVRSGVESQLRKAMAERIVNNRDGSKKPASKDEVDTEFHRAIHVQAHSTYPALKQFIDALKDEDQWQDRVDKLDIILHAWQNRASLVRTEARLMETMLQQNLISIPERRQVYKKWPGEYPGKGMIPIGSEEDDGKL